MSLDITFKNTGESFNITHNLSTMAKECKIPDPFVNKLVSFHSLPKNFTLYDLLWNGEKYEVDTYTLAKLLPYAIRELHIHSKFFNKYDARALYGTDWGLREHLIKFCEDLLLYSIKHTEMVEVSK